MSNSFNDVTNEEVENFMDKCMKQFANELKARELEKNYLEKGFLAEQKIKAQIKEKI